MPRVGILSGNALKFIAAFAMVCDHTGLLFFPGERIFRIIGRLALPIFAYMIAEGCRYTKNKVRYFFTIFGLAAVCQAVYYIAARDTYMCILVTFSLAILVIYAMQKFKAALLSGEPLFHKLISGSVFVLSVISVYVLNELLTIDYGFFGCMLPVFCSLLHPVRNVNSDVLERLDSIPVHTLMLTVGLVMLALDIGGTQWYSLLVLPLMLMYSGKRGQLNTKYFFYVFYPLHLALLQGLDWIIG